ncbi:MAG TPA: hypothetical protein VJI96_00475 [Candidatus Andersenbacteria bacterium]|nr:hypothetical protein [Candidatus Andersenbacteria bacterium]
MLYDVLPPLMLFISFGGIIVVVSRVVLRMRHVQFSEDIQIEVNSSKPIHEESLLRPTQSGVTLVKNRLVHMLQSTGSKIRSIREHRSEAKKQKALAPAVPVQVSTVQMPEVGLQDRLAVLAQKGKEGLVSLHKEIANRIPDMQTIKNKLPRRAEQEVTPPKSSPAIRLVRHGGIEETAPTKEEVSAKTGIMSQILKRDKDKTILEKAADALARKDFDGVEDMLVPHIMKHSSDAKAYMLLGKAAIGKESWDEAMETFQQVIKMDKNLVDAYADLGHAALNAGKFTLAIQSLQHARDMDASNVRIREELLFIARRMDNKVVEKGVLEELEELREKA